MALRAFMNEPALFQPQGSLNAAVMERFQRELTDWLDQTPARVLKVDFAQVYFMDSSTLVVLVNALKRVQREGRQLILTGITPDLRIIFELTQLDRIFTIDETPPLAIAA